MCYQKFVTFTCGCGTLETDEPCELMTHPFSIRLLCPDYSSESFRAAFACSLDGFVCAKSKDYRYVHDLYRLRYDAHARCMQLKQDQNALQNKLHEMTVNGQTRLRLNGGHETYLSSEQLSQQLNAKVEQCNAIARKGRLLEQCIQQVRDFYLQHGGPNSPHNVFSQTPSFVNTMGRRIPDLSNLTLLNGSKSTPPVHVPESHSTTMQPPAPIPPPTTDVIVTQGTTPLRGRPERTINHTTPARRGRKSASPAKSETQEEKPTIRHSTRVTRKKINYEESDPTSPTRAVSPGESDVSGFDPSNRSDSSGSPERSQSKRKRNRPSLQSQSSELKVHVAPGRGDSIGSKINEYRERLSRTASPARVVVKYKSPALPSKISTSQTIGKPPPLSQPYHNSQAPPGFFNGRANVIQDSRPPTRHGPPDRQQLRNPNFNNFAQPPAMPNFLPNQQAQRFAPPNNFMLTNATQTRQPSGNSYGSNDERTQMNGNVAQANTHWLTSTPLQYSIAFPGSTSRSTTYEPALPIERADSTTDENSFGLPPIQVENTPTESPYERMRRSLGAAADFTPPAATNTTPPITDPKKRKQPVSSPLQGNQKRPRLSFPGDELPIGTPVFQDQQLPKSSPSKMTSHSLHQDLGDNLNPPTPAPNFAPTAVMYRPSLQQMQFAVTTGVSGSEQTVLADSRPGQGVAVEGDYDEAFFDELIEDDVFSSELPDFLEEWRVPEMG